MDGGTGSTAQDAKPLQAASPLISRVVRVLSRTQSERGVTSGARSPGSPAARLSRLPSFGAWRTPQRGPEPDAKQQASVEFHHERAAQQIATLQATGDAQYLKSAVLALKRAQLLLTAPGTSDGIPAHLERHAKLVKLLDRYASGREGDERVGARLRAELVATCIEQDCDEIAQAAARLRHASSLASRKAQRAFAALRLLHAQAALDALETLPGRAPTTSRELRQLISVHEALLSQAAQPATPRGEGPVDA